jgi:lysophosphatidylcholine acyltransferase/lyso-PAF acetyltransferase
MPVIGAMMVALQSVFVDRDRTGGGHSALETIVARAKHTKHATTQAAGAATWPQTLIFPEGICHNADALTMFKRGAFVAGVPVQPCVFRYRYTHFNPAWLHAGPSLGASIFRLACQVYNSMEVQFLPVYVPSPEEMKDPILYAANVRRVCARALGVPGAPLPTTLHCYEDVRLSQMAARAHYPAASAAVEFGALHKLYHMEFSEVTALLKEFESMDEDRDGYVTLEEWADALELPVTPLLRENFNLLDVDGDGRISFREFAIGLLFAARDATSHDTIHAAFEVFSRGESSVSRADFEAVLRKAFPTATREQVSRIFKHVDTDESGSIELDEFKAYAIAHPEYMKIFEDWQAHAPQNTEGAAEAAVATPADGGAKPKKKTTRSRKAKRE